MRHYINHSVITDYNIQQSQKDSNSIATCDKLYARVNEDGSFFTKKQLFNEVAKSTTNASAYALNCEEIVENCTNQHESQVLESMFYSSILPMTPTSIIEVMINSNDVKNEAIKENAKDIIIDRKICNRIVSNHKRILEMVDIKDLEDTHDYRTLRSARSVTERCCNAVDSFDIPVYAKINAVIEEMFYQSGSLFETYDTNGNGVIESTKRFFANQITPEDKDNVNSVLENSPCIMAEEDIPYICKTMRDGANLSGIISSCNAYCAINNPTNEDFDKLLADICNAQGWDILSNIEYFFNTIETIISINNKYDMDYILNKSLPTFYDQFYSAHGSDDDAKNLFTKVATTINGVDSSLDNIKSEYKEPSVIIDNLDDYEKVLDDLYDQIIQASDYIYTKYNLEAAKYFKLSESTSLISLNEFKLFKFNNLISQCIAIDKYLKDKFKHLKTVGLLNYNKFKSKIFKEAEVYDVVNPDGSIDYCVESILINKNDNCSDLHEELTSLIKEVNYKILRNTNYNCYYTINPDNAEIRIKSISEMVDLEEDDKALIESFNSEEDIDRMSILLSMGNSLDENFDFTKSLSEYLYKNRENKLGGQQADIIVKSCSLLGLPKESVKEAFEVASNMMDKNDRCKFNIRNSAMLESYTPCDSDDETVFESLFILEAIIDEDKNQGKVNPNNPINKVRDTASNIKDNIKKNVNNIKDNITGAKDNDKSSSDKNKKSSNDDKADNSKLSEDETDKFTKNLNSMKLMLNGIATKAKDLGQKEKEASNNADAAFDRLSRSAKDLLVSDRREAIIKGSIIPSFSKCVKIGIGLIGLGFVTQNPIVPAIALIGGIAASKRLTRKERMLLMDDIEVELDVIDKEISNAESKNQMKKMRALMKTKKDLQRQYQRIKYNIRVGQDLLPAGVGTDNRSNEYD